MRCHRLVPIAGWFAFVLLCIPASAQNLISNPYFDNGIADWDPFRPGNGILLWSNVFPSGCDDEIFDAIGDAQVTVGINLAHIAGPEPSIHESRGGLRWFLVVAFHDIRTADLDLSVIRNTHLTFGGILISFSPPIDATSGDRLLGANQEMVTLRDGRACRRCGADRPQNPALGPMGKLRAGFVTQLPHGSDSLRSSQAESDSGRLGSCPKGVRLFQGPFHRIATRQHSRFECHLNFRRRDSLILV